MVNLTRRGVRATAPKQPAPDEPSSDREASARCGPAWAVPVAVVTVPAVIAGVALAFGRPKSADAQTIAVSQKECGRGFSVPKPGRQTFQMHNTGDKTSESLIRSRSGSGCRRTERPSPGPGTSGPQPGRRARRSRGATGRPVRR